MFCYSKGNFLRLQYSLCGLRCYSVKLGRSMLDQLASANTLWDWNYLCTFLNKVCKQAVIDDKQKFPQGIKVNGLLAWYFPFADEQSKRFQKSTKSWMGRTIRQDHNSQEIISFMGDWFLFKINLILITER